jgi:hypothetical protein
MGSEKKLQVFVSSTYSDLREERQAAVEAILASGHIPAGMELFAAGDESQMQVIRRWIDESDVFMLILGSRYGSIEPETQKSYVQLEYEYALSKQKPLFAVVKAGTENATATEAASNNSAANFWTFRDLVTKKVVRFWNDPRDIKLSVHETLAEFARRPELVGWRHTPDVDFASISQEVARLSSDNSALRERLAASSARMFNGLTFEELFRLLSTTRLRVSPQNSSDVAGLAEIAQFFGHPQPAPLHVLWRFSSRLLRGANFPFILRQWVQALEEYGLIELAERDASDTLYRLTPTGKQFLLCLRNAYDMTTAEDYRA